MSEKRKIPAFKSEAEEARWWFENRDARDEEFAQAIADGRAGKNSLSSRAAASLRRPNAKPENAGAKPRPQTANPQTN
jgi:hypothetical protein